MVTFRPPTRASPKAEILAFDPRTGLLEFGEYSDVLDQFALAANIDRGNLDSRDRKDKYVLAGNFNDDPTKTDLLLLDRGNGQLERYGAATVDNRVTFWYAWRSRAGTIGPNEWAYVVNIDGGEKDGLAVRSLDGTVRLLDVRYDGGDLPVNNEVLGGHLGRLPRSRIIAARVRSGTGAILASRERRSDVLIYDPSAENLDVRGATSRRSPRQETFRRIYQSDVAVTRPNGFKAAPFAVILCRFSDEDTDLAIERQMRETFRPGSGGLVEYWDDVTGHAVTIRGTRVFGWVDLGLKRADVTGKRRGWLIDRAIDAARRVGIEPVRGFFSQIAVFTHNFTKDGAPADANSEHETWGEFWIDGSADGAGRVSAPPHAQGGSFLAHEMGHSLGLNHDLAPDLVTEYGDARCIMSAMNVWSSPEPNLGGRQFGPTLCAPHLDISGWLDPHRVFRPRSTWPESPTSREEFELAPLSDPRQDAYLAAVLSARTEDFDYYLELLVPTRWNQGFSFNQRGGARVAIRRLVGDTVAYLDEVLVPAVVGNTAAVTERRGGVRFTVERLDSMRRVKVTATPV